jgi:hypothetical protein
MATIKQVKRGGVLAGIVAALSLVIAGCNSDPYADVRYSDAAIKLKDDVRANVALDEGLEDSLAGLEFTDVQGNKVDLAQYRGKKNLVLVITRGYGAGGDSRAICIYCASQTSRLIDHYDEFSKRSAEVLVVFPVENTDIRTTFDAIGRRTYQELNRQPEPTPFPLLLDVDLMAVDKLAFAKTWRNRRRTSSIKRAA